MVAFKTWNQYKTAGINTAQISQQLNEEILKLSGKENLPHPLGADRQTGRAWGGHTPRDAEAVRQIIKAVKLLPPGEKLDMICLGALTNIASAITIDTGIAAKMNIFLLGAQYDAVKKCWNKNEFNIRNDLNAFDYLLDNRFVNLTVMPVNTARPYTFNRDSLYKLFDGGNLVLSYLKDRWEQTNP